MKNQEVVTLAKFHDFKNDDGQLQQGGKIYILGKRIATTSDYGGSCGHQVAEVKCSKELAQKIMQKVPALYDIEYDVNINRDNAITLLPVAAELVKEFKLL